MRTIQTIGVPAKADAMPDVDAVVVGAEDAHDRRPRRPSPSRWPRSHGCRRRAPALFFKYCSTFDSTDAGNIGPVADALLDAAGRRSGIYCPAFPENGRTIFFGHLFVGDCCCRTRRMRHHPLTPMTDANLVRVLAARPGQGRARAAYADGRRRGAAPSRSARRACADDGMSPRRRRCRPTTDLVIIGRRSATSPLVTGGSGVALGLPAELPPPRIAGAKANADALPADRGRAAVLAGSCSAATLGQIERMQATMPALKLDADARRGEPRRRGARLGQATARQRPVLIYASDEPEAVEAVQAEIRPRAGRRHRRRRMAALAEALVAAGVGRLVVAGGETSGAVVGALDVTALRIGPEIDPGVPWTGVGRQPALLLALKSGNFGAPDFFTKAFGRCHEQRSNAIRDAICALGRSSRARPRPGTSGNISARIDRRLADDADQILARRARPRAALQARRFGQARRRRSADQGSAAASLGLRGAAARTAPSCICIARMPWRSPASTDAPPPRNDAAADHALLRDARRQAAAGALLQAGRSQARRRDPRLRRAIARCCWPTTARWSPARPPAAGHASEELEETASSILLLRHEKTRFLSEPEATELRRRFPAGRSASGCAAGPLHRPHRGRAARGPAATTS